MDLYNLEQKLDIIISMLNNNMGTTNMAMCPYCNEMGDINFNEIMHDKFKRKTFFSTAELVDCDNCNKDFYKTNLEPVVVKRSFQSNPGVAVVGGFNKTLDISVSKSKFEKLKAKYYDNGELVNFLPDPLKESYSDALVVFASGVTDKHKLGSTRLIIEEYLRYTNGVDEADRIRIEINKIENKELRVALHKIVDETIKAIHAKKELPTMNPKTALKTLELLFTLLYKLPKEHEKIQEEHRQKRENMESQFSNILKSL